MEVEKIDRFIIDNRKYLPEEKLAFLKQKLCETDESRFAVVCSVRFQDPTKFLLTSIFLGIFGVDRFALGDTGMGVLKLLTLGGCGMLALYDCITVREKVRQLNYNNLMLAL